MGPLEACWELEKEKEVPTAKETEIDGSGLRLLGSALGFWQRIPEKLHRWFWMGRGCLGAANTTTAVNLQSCASPEPNDAAVTSRAQR